MDTYKPQSLDSIRARAEQVRRLIGMTDDPEMAMNLRCCAQGLNDDIDELAVELRDEGAPQDPVG